jgi:hypothetical protein
MDLVWTILVWCIGLILFCCCICMVYIGYCGATCGASAMKVCCVIIIYVMTLPLAFAQVTIQSESYQPCVYYNTPFSSIQCDEKGLYTKFSINITTTAATVNETIYEFPWTAVSADLIGKSKVLNLTNSCKNHTQCNIIRNNTKITVRVLPTMIAYDLRPFGLSPAYGYYFKTYDQSSAYFNQSFAFLNVTANCSAYVSQFSNTQCVASPLFNISIPPLLPAGDLCGSNYDSLAESSKAYRVLNGLDYCEGGVCQSCPASNISQPTLSVSVPFGRCRMFRISSEPIFVYGAEIKISNDYFTRNYSVFLTSYDGATIQTSTPSQYTRGMTSKITLEGSSVPLTPGPSVHGWIVMCGNSNDAETFEPYFIGAKNPLQGVVGGVPTANGLNASVSWYYVNNDQARTDYGRDCDKNGNAGGMGPVLYGGYNKLIASCASTNAATNVVNGYCVPGTRYSAVRTPCQVASDLNDYSADVINATTNGDPLPATPINLFPDWNPTNPNYHIFRNGNTLMLARAPVGRANYPNITLGVRLDVSEMLGAYAEEIPNGVVALSQSTCAFNAYSKIGVLNIVICNIGQSVGNFVVTITHVGNAPGFNTSLIVLNATLPASQTASNVSNIIGHQCKSLPYIYTFTLNNQSQFESMFTWPHFIGNISYTITDPSGTVQLGETINPVISCDGYAGTMGYLAPYSENQSKFSCPSFQAALAFQSGCIAFSLLFYITTTIIVGAILIVIIVECCKHAHKKNQPTFSAPPPSQPPPHPPVSGAPKPYGYRTSANIRNRSALIVK